MNLEQLLTESKKWTTNYQNKTVLGADEELQMLASAYTTLFLEACANKPANEIGDAHRKIAQCFDRLGIEDLSNRHLKLASTYEAMS